MSENHQDLSAKEKEITHDSDNALDSFLSRAPQESKPVKNKKKHRILIVIIALVVVAALAALLIYLRSRPVDVDDVSDYAPASVTLSVDENGEHEASVTLDENGNIQHNGAGDLLSYFPADISRIEVENHSGSFAVTAETPEGEATVYTLIGFEDVSLQDGVADAVANDAAALAFTQIVSIGGSASDFGTDKPQATVRVTFNDDTTATIRVGNDAAAEAGTYVSFGSSDAVYLVDSEAVDAFLYNVNQFVSLDITSAAEDVDSSTFTSLTISGTRYPEPITLEPNTDEAVNASYIVTAPRRMFANATESFDIIGSVRGLSAEEVVCVNPTADQLSDYGLSEPYATVQASYPDTDITLHSSAPNDNGIVNLFNPDKNIIYTIELGAVTWAKTDIDALIPESIIDVKLRAVSGINFAAGDKDYTITVDSVIETSTNDSGDDEEVVTTTASYDDKTLDEAGFAVFFQNCNGIRNAGAASAGSGEEVMRMTFRYSTGRADDTVVAYSTGEAQYNIALNDTLVGTASKSYIDNLIKSADLLISGEPVTNL